MAGRGEQLGASRAGYTRFWKHLIADKPILPVLIPLFVLAWVIERWVVPFSNWIPLCVTVWVIVEYGKYRQREIVEELNRKWERHYFCSMPTTALEPCDWLNKLLLHIWPNYVEKKLSGTFRRLVQRRVKEKRPKPIQSIEVHDFILGNAPPVVGLQRTHWSLDGEQPVLHMGFEWNSNEMSVLLAAKLGSPFNGKVARININSMQLKGDLRFLPILDGRAILYSFDSTPDVKLGVAFGSGNQHLPATELPVLSSWLERLLVETLNRTMVEPRRRCYSLPVTDLKRRAIGGVLSVHVVKATTESQNNALSSAGGGSAGSAKIGTFVELTLGDLTRKTDTSGDSAWTDPISMVFHESAGNLHLSLYDQGPNSVKYNFLGTCEIKFRYVADGSTTFWAIGQNQGVLARCAEHCEQEVQMTVPLEEPYSGELTVKLILNEWHFPDEQRNDGPAARHDVNSYASERYTTGRKIKVTVVEGRNLAPKDRSGKSDPYLKLQYGKVTRKTKTISQNLNPVWNQVFEFEEYGDGEYLKIKCYDADFLMNDENMGSARINLHSLEVGSRKDVWVPLEKIDRGEIHLILEASELKSAKKFLDGKTLLLELVLVEARDLVAADWNGTSDPYVSVRYGTTKKRTKVIYKNLSPTWNETVELVDDNSRLELHVKDYNAIMPSSFIGQCDVDYQQLPVDQTVDRWIPLQGVHKGEIRIQLTRRQLQKHQSNIRRQRGSKVDQVSQKMRDAVASLYNTAQEEGSSEQLKAQLEELESVSEEQKHFMEQLHHEKELLLSKVKDLQRAMDGLDSSRHSSM